MPASPGPIVLATANPHKVEELRAIFSGLAPRMRLLGLNDLDAPPGGWIEPTESGTTFSANSRIKALEYARQTGHACLADDSGLEVEALALPDGTPRPGVISSHYCTDGRDTDPPMPRAARDEANNARLLSELRGVEPERRTARFVCCMCLALPDGRILQETRGAFEGRIGQPPRVPSGSNGFGYDPLFLVAPDFRRTAAELDPAEKNRLSHRAAAAQALCRWLDDA